MTVSMDDAHVRSLTSSMGSSYVTDMKSPDRDHQGIEMLVAHYDWDLTAQSFSVASLLGLKMQLDDLGQKNCLRCGRLTKKTYSQGYCFPCFRSRPETDLCIVRPEKCHIAQGTCRDPEWGQTHCMQDHAVYLSFTSHLKVGVTRRHRLYSRWMDQGAVGGVELARLNNRLQAGQLEVLLKKHYKDRTHPQKMLASLRSEPYETAIQSLAQERIQIQKLLQGTEFEPYVSTESQIKLIRYPSLSLSDCSPIVPKLVSLDKTSSFQGQLTAVKGQYLIFDNQDCFSVRKHLGYHLKITQL